MDTPARKSEKLDSLPPAAAPSPEINPSCISSDYVLQMLASTFNPRWYDLICPAEIFRDVKIVECGEWIVILKRFRKSNLRNQLLLGIWWARANKKIFFKPIQMRKDIKTNQTEMNQKIQLCTVALKYFKCKILNFNSQLVNCTHLS